MAFHRFESVSDVHRLINVELMAHHVRLNAAIFRSYVTMMFFFKPDLFVSIRSVFLLCIDWVLFDYLQTAADIIKGTALSRKDTLLSFIRN